MSFIWSTPDVIIWSKVLKLSYDQQFFPWFQMINMLCYHSINTQLDGIIWSTLQKWSYHLTNIVETKLSNDQHCKYEDIIWSTLQKWSYHLINIVETKVSNDQQKITTMLSCNQHSWNNVIVYSTFLKPSYQITKSQFIELFHLPKWLNIQ